MLSDLEKAKIIELAGLYVMSNHAKFPMNGDNFVSEVKIVTENLESALRWSLTP